jgi:thiol-disulfide isomerase/thioredoxin
MEKFHLPFRAKLAMVAVAGILCGVAVIYAMNTGERKGAQMASCGTSDAALASMREKAVGEVAGVIVPKAPRPLSDLAFQNAQGENITLASFKGKITVLNLWATWCIPCREEMPALNSLQQKLGGEKFEVLAVSVDMQGQDKAKAFLAEHKIDQLGFYASPDGKLFQDMQRIGRAVGLPTSLIIDGTGCEIGYLPGPADWAHGDAIGLLQAAINHPG